MWPRIVTLYIDDRGVIVIEQHNASVWDKPMPPHFGEKEKQDQN